MALFGIDGVDISSVAFVEVDGSLKAGHAAHPRCSAARKRSLHHVAFCEAGEC